VRPESIAPEELRAAIRIALGRELGLAREALVSGAARVMGFARTGPALSAAIEENVDAMLASGEIAPDPNGFLVLRPE
jgi:hypothetical protein